VAQVQPLVFKRLRQGCKKRAPQLGEPTVPLDAGEHVGKLGAWADSTLVAPFHPSLPRLFKGAPTPARSHH